jgi:hypothetical protein
MRLVEWKGREYEIVSIDDMTIGEMRDFKRMSGGMTPVSAGVALAELDPDAWIAAVAVSIRRVSSDFDESELLDHNLQELVLNIRDTDSQHIEDELAGAEADAGPPV